MRWSLWCCGDRRGRQIRQSVMVAMMNSSILCTDALSLMLLAKTIRRVWRMLVKEAGKREMCWVMEVMKRCTAARKRGWLLA